MPDPFVCGLLAVAVGLAGCGDKEQTEPTRSRQELLPTRALQIAPKELSRLEVTRTGHQPIVLKPVREDAWVVIAPISYPANWAMVEPMIAVLAEIHIQGLVAQSPESHHRLHKGGILIRAWRGKKLVEFTIGASVGEETYVQRQGDRQVYAALGRCRRIFDHSLEKLRDPVIASLNLGDIASVQFTNKHGKLSLMADAATPGRFVETRPRLHNFYAERASKSVAVLTKLFAKSFVDPPFDQADTGLFEQDTARAEIFFRETQIEGQEPLVVYIGHHTKEGQLYVRTSRSDQVFLVSGHLGSSLMPDPKLLERSDNDMQGLVKQKHGEAEASEELASKKEHAHSASLPTQVSPQLMKELRELALQNP